MTFINSLMAAVAMAGHLVPLSTTSELNLGVRHQGVGMSEVSKAPKPDQALAKVNGVEIKASEIEGFGSKRSGCKGTEVVESKLSGGNFG